MRINIKDLQRMVREAVEARLEEELPEPKGNPSQLEFGAEGGPKKSKTPSRPLEEAAPGDLEAFEDALRLLTDPKNRAIIAQMGLDDIIDNEAAAAMKAAVDKLGSGGGEHGDMSNISHGIPGARVVSEAIKKLVRSVVLEQLKANRKRR